MELKSALRMPGLFVSLEPLLGPVDLTGVQTARLKWDVLQGYQYAIAAAGSQADWQAGTAHLDWVIVGGESGPGARPLHPEWVRAVRDQCGAAGVPFHFKQWGEWLPNTDFDEFDYRQPPDQQVIPYKSVHVWRDGSIALFNDN